MPIYLDPSETCTSTRMPKAVIDQGKALTGLERATGADFLITTKDIVMPQRGFGTVSLDTILILAEADTKIHSPADLADRADVLLPDVLAILGATEAIRHGVLVQRKSGGDFISSIPNLRDIRNRMLRWTWRSWLLVTGEFDTKNGHVVVDGRETGTSPASAYGAIDSWRMDGGQVDVLESDDEIGKWVASTLGKLAVMERKGDDDGRMRRYRRAIPDRDDDRARALAILATLKGVGEGGARKLLDYYGTLAGALEACLDPSIPKSKYRPGGVLGETTVRANRELFGMPKNFKFVVVPPAGAGATCEDDPGTD